MNAFMHTGGLISGPEKYIGTSPRIETHPASLVDLLPTIVDMLDLNVEYATWGRSLIAEIPDEDRVSILVRPGGIRLNWRDSSLFVNSNNPNDYWVTTFNNKINDRNDFRSENMRIKAKQVYDLVQYGSYLTESDMLLPKE